MTNDAQHRIETYLGKLRRQLRGMNEEDVREIIEELRSHITDKAAASGEITVTGVEAALAALGSPEELASRYVTDALLARAEVSRSPVQILVSLASWGSLSAAGFFVLAGAVLGYFLGFALMLAAVLKPFHPQTAGLWLIPDSAGDSMISLRMGFGTAPSGGREILGWWIVPLGLLASCAVVVGTTRLALWCVRQYRRSRALPQD